MQFRQRGQRQLGRAERPLFKLRDQVAMEAVPKPMEEPVG
jgi:hypothetical protein